MSAAKKFSCDKYHFFAFCVRIVEKLKINDVLEFYLVFKGKLDTRKKICVVVHHMNS